MTRYQWDSETVKEGKELTSYLNHMDKDGFEIFEILPALLPTTNAQDDIYAYYVVVARKPRMDEGGSE